MILRLFVYNSNLDRKYDLKSKNTFYSAGILCEDIYSNANIAFIPLTAAKLYNISIISCDVFGHGIVDGFQIFGIYDDGFIVKASSTNFKGCLLQVNGTCSFK